MSSVEVPALLRRAWAALQQGQPVPARADCEAALQLAPESFDAWRLYAIVLQAQGDGGGGRGALERAWALRPGDAGTALDLGTLLLQAGDGAAALPMLATAMRALPQEPRAAFRYGTAAYVGGDFRAAASGFEAAARLDPQWTQAWNNLAAAHGRLQDYPAAIAAARNALRLEPGAASAHQALAALLSNLFDRTALEEGLRCAQRALQLQPGFAEAHRNAAIVLRKLGEPARAEAHARQALQLAPRDVDTVDTLGEQLLLNGDTTAAVATYAQALAAGVSSPVLQRQHGIALLQDGQPESASQALLKVLQEQPDDQRAIAHLGVAMAAQGRAEAAGQWLGLHRHVHAIELLPPEAYIDHTAFHAALAADIRRHSQQRWEPAGLAARNAYLSGDLLADRTTAITGFEQRLRSAIDAFLQRCRAQAATAGADADVFLRNVPNQYRLHVWATQAAERGYIDTHIHEDSWLSGAYYVELPPAIRADDAGHAGWIEFGRPFASLPQWPEAELRQVCPRAGTLLLFPSYMFHRTLPYTGSGERISISFDLAAV
ncbi:putative 2OG-Fe(II) oxygenase [Lysobacter sp. TAF61]|uniref:putative 2OG-Fe(II) oxygenase n=1 Tax=Lysobacter sp. TAF61 TaxID=3233072 RepID=UPI003F998B8E